MSHSPCEMIYLQNERIDRKKAVMRGSRAVIVTNDAITRITIDVGSVKESMKASFKLKALQNHSFGYTG
jgi:hypothetical protein